jgi:hypothetical protein
MTIKKITAITVQTKSGGQSHVSLMTIKKITAITVQTKNGQSHASLMTIKKITAITVQTKKAAQNHSSAAKNRPCGQKMPSFLL